jgi:hypothetical protein
VYVQPLFAPAAPCGPLFVARSWPDGPPPRPPPGGALGEASAVGRAVPLRVEEVRCAHMLPIVHGALSLEEAWLAARGWETAGGSALRPVNLAA